MGASWRSGWECFQLGEEEVSPIKLGQGQRSHAERRRGKIGSVLEVGRWRRINKMIVTWVGLGKFRVSRDGAELDTRASGSDSDAGAEKRQSRDLAQIVYLKMKA
jgi:hypothetical protein